MITSFHQPFCQRMFNRKVLGKRCWINDSSNIRSNDSNDLSDIKSFQRTCDFLLIDLYDIINIFLCKYTAAHHTHMHPSWWSLQTSLATACYFYYKTSDPCDPWSFALKKMETKSNYCHFHFWKSVWILFKNNLMFSFDKYATKMSTQTT